VTIALYRAAHAFALGKGMILADTKFEFGMSDGQLVLIDEALTPDSSRYWDASKYTTGRTPPSYDKQYVRDFVTNSGWNKEPPAPALPKDVVAGTTARYRECYEKLTGDVLA
jgi:phosphoribosylaminoimidazole-succinocarboxamide synthase